MMSEFELLADAIIRGDLDSVRTLFKKEFISEKYCGHTLLQCASMKDKSGEIVNFLLCMGSNIETEDKQGRRAIHLAARQDKAEALAKLIEGGCCLDCRDNNGKTALDLAKLYNNEKCAKILISAMEKKNIGPTSGTHILEGLFKIGSKFHFQAQSDVSSDLELLECNFLSKILNIRTGKTLLDKLLSYKDPRVIEIIKSKQVSKEEISDWISTKAGIVDSTSYDLLHECLLYRCLRHNYQEGCATLCTPEMVNRRSLFMGPTALETAVTFENVLCVERCLRMSVNVDDSWTRASNLAQKKELSNISFLIFNRMVYLKRKENNKCSRLHVAVYDNDADMVRYILENKTIDPYLENKTAGTALRLAYELGHLECVQSLQNNNVDVNTINKLRQSTLHLAILNRMEEHCEYLVDNTTITDTKDYMGFTVLELSVLNDCRNICERIVKRTSELNRYVNIDSRLLDVDPDLTMVSYRIPHIPITVRETIFSLCIKVNRTIYPCLLDAIDDSTIHMVDGNKNSMLHLCSISLLTNICTQLINKSANLNLGNEHGRCPLFELLAQNCGRYTKLRNGIVGGKDSEGYNECCSLENEIIETVTVLVTSGTVVDVKDTDGCSLLQKASEYHSERLLMALIQRKEPLETVKEPLWLSWFHTKYFTFLSEVMPLISKSSLSKWIKQDLIKCAVTVSDTAFVRLLYDKALYDVQTSVVETILYDAVMRGDRELFEEMSNNDISSKSSLIDGESLMSWLIRERKTEFCRILLRSKNKHVLLEKKNSENKLPLHVCIENNLWDIIDQIILGTISINQEDVGGNTPLSLLLGKISEEVEVTVIDRLMGYINTLILKSGDIYYVNRLDKTAIDYCTRDNLKQEIITLPSSLPKPSLVSDSIICPICFKETIDCRLNCGHCFCMTCANNVINCFNCRALIFERKKLFI